MGNEGDSTELSMIAKEEANERLQPIKIKAESAWLSTEFILLKRNDVNSFVPVERKFVNDVATSKDRHIRVVPVTHVTQRTEPVASTPISSRSTSEQ